MPNGDIFAADDVPAYRLAILLRVEDPRFFEHHGLDLWTPGSGYTTITQALAKRLYFDSFEPGPKKILQTLYAVGLDLRVDKSTQLTLFLNTVYLGSVNGRDITGMGQAARTYFKKEFGELSDEEYLMLVAMIVGPDYYHPIAARERNRLRVERIKRVLSGRCRPSGVSDVYYRACR